MVSSFVGATATASETETPEIHLDVEEVHLDNGLTLLLVDRPSAPDLAAGWVVHAGSADDPPGRRGLAHVLEHLLFKGTETIGTRDYQAERAAGEEIAELRREIERLRSKGKGAGRRAREIETRLAEVERRRQRLLRPGELSLRYSEAGATGLNGFTFEDFTLYFVRLPAGKLELWFWLESDRLSQPVFRDFTREKEVIRQEVGQRIGSTPTGRADQELRRAFWGESSYAWRALGRLDDLPRVEKTDAESFFDRHYRPENLTAVVVGPIDRDRTVALARGYFGRLPAGEAVDGAPPRRTTPPSPAKGPLELRCDCPRQTRALYPTVAFRHPHSYALQVLAGVLNGRTGRLHRSLVLDREIAFTASATQLSYRDAGSFVFAAETKGDAKPEELLAAWEEEIEGLRNELVGDTELRKVKNQLIASSLRGLRRPSDLARQLLVYAGLGEWRQIEDRPRRVGEVTAEEVREAARGLKEEDRLVAYYRAADLSGASGSKGPARPGDNDGRNPLP